MDAAPAGADADRAPDCTTPRAAAIAGILSGAVMAREMSFNDPAVSDAVSQRLKAIIGDERDVHSLETDIAEGVRTAQLMIEARARASVRTPSGAALSAAEAVLALAEDCLDPTVAWNDGEEDPDVLAVLASIRDTLRQGLSRLHATDQAAGPPGP